MSASPKLFDVSQWLDPRLEAPEGEFAAIIFDCDGTLVDSMPVHLIAWQESLKHHQAPYEFTDELFHSLAGIREKVAVEMLNERFGANLDGLSVEAYKLELIKHRFHLMKEITPVANLARAAHAAGMPISVASGSEEITVRGCLQNSGLLPLFDILITPVLVQHGKPAPDMFLLAAERMGIPPELCLVLEDGQPGVDAANAAGMKSVFVPRTVR